MPRFNRIRIQSQGVMIHHIRLVGTPDERRLKLNVNVIKENRKLSYKKLESFCQKGQEPKFN